MKMYAKSLALLALLFALLFLTGVCASAEIITGTAGDLTWTVDSDAATLTISGSGEMSDYRYVIPKDGMNYTTAPWFDHRTLFSQVIVENGVTSIGAHAFRDLSITSVSLPNTLLSIGDYALNSYSLKTVRIPESVVSVGNYVYANDTVVSGLMARGVSGATVWEIRDGTLTVSGEIPDYGWTTPTGKYDISHLDTPWYSYDYDITSVVVSKGVTYIGANAFYDIYNLEKVTIPSTVTAIGKDAFAKCMYINYVNFTMEYDESASKWPLISFANANSNPLAGSGKAILYANGIEVSYIVLQGDVTPYAFYNCQNSFGVAASGGKLTKVGDYAFYCCYNLYEASLPTSVNHIGKYAFYCCRNLAETYCLLDGATYVGDRAFYMCESLTEINMKRYANNEMTYLGEYAFSYCTAVTKVTLGSVSAIPSCCFQGSSMITDIALPDGLTEIADRAFSSCSSLTSLTLPDTVQSIGEYAFSSCNSLTSLTLPESIQTISAGLFYYNDGITSVTIPAAVQSVGNYAFAYCDNLTSVTFEGKAPTFASYAFNSTKNAVIQYFPGSSWSGKTQNYGGSLTWKPIGGSCGNATWQLTENGLLRITGNGAVAAGAWSAYADRINEILLGPGVTAVEAQAFAGLSNVTKIAVAGPVTQIAGDAFTGVTADVYWNQNDATLCAFVESFVPSYEAGFGGTLNWRHPVCSVTSSTTAYSIRVTEHTLSAVNAAEPTCTEEGCTDYWKCTCGMVFADHDPLTRADADAFVIPATGHMYDVSFVWAEDGSACQAVFTCQFGDAETTLDAVITASQISDPDCTNNGETEYTALAVLEETDPAAEYTDTIVLADIPALGHTEAIIPGLEPSCEEVGMMDYIFCEVCGEELQPADEIPALGHTETVMSEAFEPTCTQDGATELICCSVCGTTLQASQIIPMLGHRPETDPGYEPDCLNPGLSDGSHCLTCGEVLAEQEVLPELGHTVEILPSKEATDREEGLTEGSHCLTCGVILVEQQVIPARFTFDGDTVIAYNAADPDVVIPEGTTALGTTLFKNNTAIRSVRIPDSVETLGTQTFFGCTGLEDLWLPDHLTNIGAQTFYKVTARFHVGADSATAIALSYRSIAFTTEDGMILRYRVTSATGTPTAVWIAGYCGGATDVVIPGAVCDTPVTQILANAFAGQTQMTSISIPDSVTSIDATAFTGVTELTVYCNESSYAEMWATENGYTVILPVVPEDEYEYTINESGHVTITRYVGEGGDVTIPAELGGGMVTAIGTEAFKNCTALTGLVIPDGVMSIGSQAFYNCPGMVSVTIPNSVMEIGTKAFYYCPALTSVTLPDSLTVIAPSAFEFCSSLTSLVIPDCVTEIGAFAFDCCTGLTSVTIPDSVTSIGAQAFSACTNLTSVTIPKSVTSIGNFALESSVTICCYRKSAADFWAQSNGNPIEYLNVPEAVDYSYIITDGAATVTGGYTAYDEALVIPDTLEGYPVVAIGDYAFNDCVNLPSITLPESVISIGNYAFAYCNALSSITLPESLTSIGESAFWNCISLTSITIPESVTIIGREAFNSCTNLTSIIIPETVTSIGDYAFHGCGNLVAQVKRGSYAYHWCVANGITVLTDELITLMPADRIRADAAPAGLAASMEVTDGSFHVVIDDDATDWNSLRTFTDGRILLGTYISNPEGAAYSKCVSGGNWTTDEDLMDSLRAHDIVDDLRTHGHGLWLDAAAINAENGEVSLYEINDAIPFVCAILWMDENGEEMFAEKVIYCFEHTNPEGRYTASRLPISAGDILPNAGNAAGVTSAVSDGSVTYTCQPGADVTTMILAPEAAVRYSLCADGYDPYIEQWELTDGSACLDAQNFPTDAETTRLLCWYDAYGMLLGGGEITIRFEQKLLTTRLPASLVTIEEEVFLGSAMECVILPDGCVSIGSRAFADCASLSVVHVPDSVRFIAEDAFDGCGELTFVCTANSAAAVYARAHGFTCQEP